MEAKRLSKYFVRKTLESLPLSPAFKKHALALLDSMENDGRINVASVHEQLFAEYDGQREQFAQPPARCREQRSQAKGLQLRGENHPALSLYDLIGRMDPFSLTGPKTHWVLVLRFHGTD